MASLIIQDAFEPYYAGRESSEESAKLRAAARKQAERGGKTEAEIVLPSKAPLRPNDRPRDSRRATEH